MAVNKPVNVTGKLTATSINLENTDLVTGAAGAIVAGTNDIPTIEKIEEISQLVEVNPR